jgi:hypothetical protein
VSQLAQSQTAEIILERICVHLRLSAAKYVSRKNRRSSAFIGVHRRSSAFIGGYRTVFGVQSSGFRVVNLRLSAFICG